MKTKIFKQASIFLGLMILNLACSSPQTTSQTEPVTTETDVAPVTGPGSNQGVEIGNASGAPTGKIQKGPFITGATVTIKELNENLVVNGTNYFTSITDDLGNFTSLSVPQTAYVEIKATGFYFNEVSNQLSDAQLTLRSISDLSLDNTVNVNILTTMSLERVRYLINSTGMSYAEARAQAESEVLDIFGITQTNLSQFDQMDVSLAGISNTALVAISATMQGQLSVAELSQFIAQFNLDMMTDGTLDSVLAINQLCTNYQSLDLVAVQNNLQGRYQSQGASSVVISNLDGIIDLECP